MYICDLRDNYKDFEEFKAYAEIYGLHTRLGYKTPETAWQYNPRIQGGVNPGDFKKVSKKVRKHR
jgi:hypothetical protein